MKFFLFSAFILSVMGLAACNNEGSKEPAASPRGTDSRPPSAATPPGKSLPKIVAFGDSLTAGYGIRNSESYPSLLQKRLDAEGYEYEVVNAGVSGDTSAGGVRRIDWALEGDVRVVIVELGANDILRGQPIEQMKKNLGQIIERAQSRGAKVLLAGMEAPTNSGFDYRKDVHNAFREVAQKYQVPVIPFLLDRVAGIESLNQVDGVHPNAEGTRIVAETVYQALLPLLEKPGDASR